MEVTENIIDGFDGLDIRFAKEKHIISEKKMGDGYFGFSNPEGVPRLRTGLLDMKGQSFPAKD